LNEHVQVITTTANKPDAEKIAEFLVERKLAACVQIIGPISSVYWWEGKMEKTSEWLCLIKTTKALYENLEKALRKIHPYKVPEILATPVVAGNNDYFSWLDRALDKSQQ